ncbi:unnamed protein product [Polarella glacialis]|uniref:Uncharacterized protein n=1 Tax=Polarella glacialis TaxID=89957 RepID=A0A813EMA5_POLGL|nr:unnamed protein product [Polarella glacialis]
MPIPQRVLFIHGLESGVGGGKHRFLARHYPDVECVDMSMSLLNLRKSNGILRNVLVHAASTAPWNLLKVAVQASLDGCLAAQREALRSTSSLQGVVVASSWGGAVALLALARGDWRGPTVLIAPAYAVATSRAGVYDASYEPHALYAAIAERLGDDGLRQVVIVHGTADTVVDIAYSRELAVATGIALVEIEGGDHSMKCLLQGDALKNLVAKVCA